MSTLQPGHTAYHIVKWRVCCASQQNRGAEVRSGKTGKAQIEHNFSARLQKADSHWPLLLRAFIIKASNTARPSFLGQGEAPAACRSIKPRIIIRCTRGMASLQAENFDT
jgi:hypothetical protein